MLGMSIDFLANSNKPNVHGDIQSAQFYSPNKDISFVLHPSVSVGSMAQESGVYIAEWLDPYVTQINDNKVNSDDYSIADIDDMMNDENLLLVDVDIPTAPDDLVLSDFVFSWNTYDREETLDLVEES